MTCIITGTDYDKGKILRDWVAQNTKGCFSVIEFGCGWCTNMQFIDPDVKTIIGIEIWQPYIDIKIANYNVIQGDARNYRMFIGRENYDCAMIVDFLEHLSKEDAHVLMNSLQQDFNKVMLMIPIGEAKQDYDTTGFGAHKYQKHRSYWTEDDVKKMGFDYIYYTNFHSSDIGCIFGVWNRI